MLVLASALELARALERQLARRKMRARRQVRAGWSFNLGCLRGVTATAFSVTRVALCEYACFIVMVKRGWAHTRPLALWWRCVVLAALTCAVCVSPNMATHSSQAHAQGRQGASAARRYHRCTYCAQHAD